MFAFKESAELRAVHNSICMTGQQIAGSLERCRWSNGQGLGFKGQSLLAAAAKTKFRI